MRVWCREESNGWFMHCNSFPPTSPPWEIKLYGSTTAPCCIHRLRIVGFDPSPSETIILPSDVDCLAKENIFAIYLTFSFCPIQTSKTNYKETAKHTSRKNLNIPRQTDTSMFVGLWSGQHTSPLSHDLNGNSASMVQLMVNRKRTTDPGWGSGTAVWSGFSTHSPELYL